MYRHSNDLISKFCILAVLLTGCHPTQPFFFNEDGDLDHYIGRATQIEVPNIDVPSLAEVEFAQAPLTIENSDFEHVWELSLDEAVRIALSNSKVQRSLGIRVNLPGQLVRASENVLVNPDGTQTMYNPALFETNAFGFGGAAIGPEAALAAFDADLTASMTWLKNDDPNNVGVVNLGRRLATVQDQGTFQAGIQKASATGDVFSFSNVTTYDQSNIDAQFRPFPSEWRTQWTAEIRHPLLQGRGVDYNRIAGPFSPRAGVGTRGFDGVLLARIDVDRSLNDLEASVRNLVSEVESVYWELYCAYQRLDAEKQGLASAQGIWKLDKARKDVGEGQVGDEERSREQYFSFQARVEQAKTDLFHWENRLRYLLGLAATDGRLIRPIEEPIRAKVVFDWYDVLGEALGRSVELRKQKWQIKRRELELVAAKNHLMPRLDFVGRYRWQGFGDRLIDPGDRFNSNGNPAVDSFRRRFDNAFGNLVSGKHQEWEMLLELNLPVGFRQELAAMRHSQLLLSRDKAVLKEQELELSHRLAEDVRDLDNWFRLIQTYLNQRVASEAQVRKFSERHKSGQESNERLLDSQVRLAQADTQYYTAVCAYTKAIAQIHLHKGSNLDAHNVYLAEGPWPGKAYFDAVRLARQRDASIYMNYVTTRGGIVSRGPYIQQTEGQIYPQVVPERAVPEEAVPEEAEPGAEPLEIPLLETSYEAVEFPPEPPASQIDIIQTSTASDGFRRDVQIPVGNRNRKTAATVPSVYAADSQNDISAAPSTTPQNGFRR
ncbi:MAG: TolC family protein, partial [Pirellulales bacterium]